MDVLFTREIRLTRVVSHDHHFFLSDTIAPDKLVEINELLQGHAERSGLVIFSPKLFKRVHTRNIFPTATVEGFKDSGQSHIVDYPLPVERKLQITQAFIADSLHVILLGEEHSLRDGDSQLSC